MTDSQKPSIEKFTPDIDSTHGEGLTREVVRFIHGTDYQALSEELIARRRHIYDLVSEILLRHRRRIVHENPEGAVRFGIYLVSAAARDALLFSEAPHAKATSLKVEPLRKELARTLYAYLTVRSA